MMSKKKFPKQKRLKFRVRRIESKDEIRVIESLFKYEGAKLSTLKF